MAKKTQQFCTAKISLLMLLKEMVTVYSEMHIEPVCTFCGKNSELNVKACGTYTYHEALNG
jgi:hypothetical protein